AYSTFNMGAGFALFVASADAQRTVAVAAEQGVRAWHAGAVEAGVREVLIEPLGIRYASEDLQLR
ncbi:MAG: phosphoribosylformylglycinamidine cyclo-ligase, partial [Caldimonas sp.]